MPVKIVSDFGFVSACHEADYPLVKATCASIRHQMPEVPIALIVDGDVDVSEVVRAHSVIPLPVRNLPDQRIVQACSHNTFAKWTCFWAAPFERFVYLDSDAIVLGNWLPWARDTNWDFCIFTSSKLGREDKAGITKHFFNPDGVCEFDPSFQWIDQPYFCAGAFAARRGFIEEADFLNLLNKFRPWLQYFKPGDQGLLNYLALKALQSGQNVQVFDRQFILPDHSPNVVLERFGHQAAIHNEPWIVHYCGVKPWLHNRQPHHALFMSYRWRHHKVLHGFTLAGRIRAALKIALEEFQQMARKARGRIQRAFIRLGL
jgi:hypothetical protein